MKHIISEGSRWSYTNDPFPQFYAGLAFGATHRTRDRVFLPTKVEARREYRVFESWEEDGAWVRKTVLQSTDRKEVLAFITPLAKGMKPGVLLQTAEESADPESPYHARGPTMVGGMKGRRRGLIDLAVTPVKLPDDQFRVITTREKGTILVVPGEDTSHNILWMGGCDGGFRGGVSLKGETTAQLLKTCKAASTTHSRIEVAVVMEPGKRVVFESGGRHGTWYHVYTWTGKRVFHEEVEYLKWKDYLNSPPLPIEPGLEP